MKRFVNIVVILAMVMSLFSPLSVHAVESYVGTVTASSGVRVRTGPGTNHDYVDFLASGATVDMVSTDLHADEGGCEGGWYEIYYEEGKKGFSCAEYFDVRVKIIYEDNKEPVTDYEKVLHEAGFPSSYWPALTDIHNEHPSWEFVAVDTGLDFYGAVSVQSVVGKSLIQTSYEGYKSTSEGSYDYLTDSFKALEAGSWYAADSDVVAYYMDPRNFLNEVNVFMFEKLNYDTSVGEADYTTALNNLLGSSYLKDNVNDFLTAGRDYDVNPVYLASLALQETGYNGSAATSGNEFSYTDSLGVTRTYSSLYNVYNIGAYTSSNPVILGLIFANGGAVPGSTSTSYGRAWNTLSKSIIGGGEYISAGYISKGQYTTYFKKFNVDPNAYFDTSHQYQTNIQAPVAESSKSYNAYEGSGQLGMDFTFSIPVYDNMPSETNLPGKGNPNNHLASIKINGVDIINFKHDSYVYEVPVSVDSLSASVSAVALNDEAAITGGGEVTITEDSTQVTLKVEAGNGDILDYTVYLVKTDGLSMSAKDVVNNSDLSTDGSYLNGLSTGNTVENLTETLRKVSNGVNVSVKTISGASKTEGKLGTGDIVTITNGTNSENFSVVINGDSDGDGDITILDLLKVQKDILNYSKLETYYFKAGDVDNNGVIDILDLLLVQKHILGYTVIR